MNPAQLLMQMMSQGNNPNLIIQNMLRNNPRLHPLMSQMQQSGLTPKEFVTQYAKQNNLNINPMLDIMNQHGIKLK